MYSIAPIIAAGIGGSYIHIHLVLVMLVELQNIMNQNDGIIVAKRNTKEEL